MNNKQIVYAKLVELFMCKNKDLKDATAEVWVNKLCEKFSPEDIAPALDVMMWNDDDFPTLGKIAKEIDNLKENKIKMIMSDWIKDGDSRDFRCLDKANNEVVGTSESAYTRVLKKLRVEYIQKYDKVPQIGSVSQIGVSHG